MQEQICPTLSVSGTVPWRGGGTSSERQGVPGDPQVTPGSLHGSVLEHPEGEDSSGGWWAGATQRVRGWSRTVPESRRGHGGLLVC